MILATDISISACSAETLAFGTYKYLQEGVAVTFDVGQLRRVEEGDVSLVNLLSLKPCFWLIDEHEVSRLELGERSTAF
jgi:hypothetical protein